MNIIFSNFRTRRIKVATSLVKTLEEHAFLLLGVLEGPELLVESTHEIGMYIYKDLTEVYRKSIKCHSHFPKTRTYISYLLHMNESGIHLFHPWG